MPKATFDSYVICTTPRSGSTLLCKLLADTGVAGNPDSYFHRPSITAWLDHFDLTPDDTVPERDVLRSVFRAAIAKGSLDTGVFGLRMQRESFGFFARKLAVLHPGLSSDIERFHAAFGRTLFIHLSRRDKVQQAISNVKAQQTGLWHAAPDGTELQRLSPAREPVYDAAAIRAKVEEVTALDRDWERWFASEAVAPLRLDYEGLAADPLQTLRHVLDALGLDRKAASGVKPGVAKLADETSKVWEARFRSEVHIE